MCIRDRVWTDTNSQLADSITKFKESKTLYKTLETGIITLGKAKSNKSQVQFTPKQKELESKIQLAVACYGKEAVDAYFGKAERRRIIDCLVGNTSNHNQKKIG